MSLDPPAVAHDVLDRPPYLFRSRSPMHRSRRRIALPLMPSLALAMLAAACGSSNPSAPPGSSLVSAPANLIYHVEPSGTPGQPTGVLLQWDATTSANLKAWNVYSRAGTSGAFRLRGSTTSRSFDDRGVPDLQYFVTAEDLNGGESESSDTVTVDERLALQSPASLTSTSLDAAIALTWSDNAFTAAPSGFSAYHVYSASYNLDTGVCGNDWSLEGTTVSPDFIASALTNGVPRCFGVSAVSVEGFESMWSPLRNDTPRPESRNIVVFARQSQSTGSAFRFWSDANANGTVDANELGLLLAGNDGSADFAVDRDVSGSLFLVPVRAGTSVAQYGTTPSADLTSIDIAPTSGFSTTPIQAVPGWGYVFQMNGGDGLLRFGGVRVTHVGHDFLILDWSFQTDPGNPELLIGHR